MSGVFKAGDRVQLTDVANLSLPADLYGLHQNAYGTVIVPSGRTTKVLMDGARHAASPFTFRLSLVSAPVAPAALFVPRDFRLCAVGVLDIGRKSFESVEAACEHAAKTFTAFHVIEVIRHGSFDVEKRVVPACPQAAA